MTSMAYAVFSPLHSLKPSTISTRNGRRALPLCCSGSSTPASMSTPPPPISTASTGTAPPVVRRRMRYRKQYPGESKGITEEMRFVAMRLRNINGKKLNDNDTQSEEDDDDDGDNDDNAPKRTIVQNQMLMVMGVRRRLGGPVWKGSSSTWWTASSSLTPSSALWMIQTTKTGLERSEGLSEDLEWFKQQGMVIPEPSGPGVSYAKYLEELADNSAPLFLCHFYNIYFSHIAGGQVIARQVSEKLLEGRELGFYTWEGDVQELLKGVREKLNNLGVHWTRDDKNKCLRETSKSFRYLGQIVRLIILELKAYIITEGEGDQKKGCTEPKKQILFMINYLLLTDL
ncbi:heme oxygenase 2 [Prunus dulcis]|uniref:Heme oxygenase 2 n=1 Tax=Prunus dulcis TaxID=3755 RepID=A0A4Y1QTS2_PRUDU|nr:heme oxygenase 2 [Prunus dulcis]